MDDRWRPQSPVEPAAGRHRTALPSGPLSVAGVWAALPPARREPARDYLAQDRLVHRFRRGHAYLAVLQGHQDAYHVYCEEGPDVWQVGCTCGRRLPCAHVGALLFAVAQDPAHFAPWPSATRRWQSQADWAWDWARGGSFPWAALRPDPPLADAPLTPDAALPNPVAELARTPTRQLSGALLDVVRTAHPGWWEHHRFNRAVAEAFLRMARVDPDPLAQVEWIQQLAEEPRIPCGALFPFPSAPHPAVAAAWRSTLWDMARAHALDPRPSQALAARALLALAPLAAAYPDMRGEFAWALPDGLSQAEWLLQQGRTAEAWWQLARPTEGTPDPFHPSTRDPYRLAVQRLAKALITGEASPPGPDRQA